MYILNHVIDDFYGIVNSLYASESKETLEAKMKELRDEQYSFSKKHQEWEQRFQASLNERLPHWDIGQKRMSYAKLVEPMPNQPFVYGGMEIIEVETL